MKTIKLFVRILMLAVAMYSHAGFAQQSQGKRSMASSASIKKTIKQYYAAYEKKDWGMMEPILADGFTFSSPAGDDHIDIKLYKQRCWPNAEHTKRFDLEKI